MLMLENTRRGVSGLGIQGEGGNSAFGGRWRDATACRVLMVRVDEEGVWPGWDGRAETANSTGFCLLPFGVVDRGIHASGVESNVVEVVMENGEMANGILASTNQGFPAPPDDARPRSGTRP